MKALIVIAALAASTTAVAQQRDSRGVVVQSEQAQEPAGVNQPVPAGAQLAAPTSVQTIPASQPSTENYVPCTRERTDNCVQTYERGRPR